MTPGLLVWWSSMKANIYSTCDTRYPSCVLDASLLYKSRPTRNFFPFASSSTLRPRAIMPPTIVFFCLLFFVFVFSRRYQTHKSNPNGLPLPPGPKGLPFIGFMSILKDYSWLTVSKWAKEYGKLLPMNPPLVV